MHRRKSGEREMAMGLFKSFVNQTRKPEGVLGKMMLSGMNSGHAKMADWGFTHLPAITPTKAVDLGCGGGYFSRQFSKLAGETGKVYATEINKDALNYLDGFIKEYGVKNIETVVTRMNDAGLPADSVDTVFMCSMYHAVYITNIEFVKDHFIDTVKKALRKNGRVIVVDNDIPDPGIPSYYGPGIIPEMIISQLHYYGFELEDRIQLIPQRFALVFRMKDKTVTKTKLKPKIKFMARITGEKLKRKPMKPQ